MAISNIFAFFLSLVFIFLFWGNVDKANKVLGWKAETPTEEVLKTAWRWQQKLREDGIQ